MLLYGNSVPNNAWIDNGDGTVTNIVTGLMWMRPALGQAWTGITSIGSAKRFLFQREKIKKITHNFAGYADWRVPSIDELMSLVDFKCKYIDDNLFPNNGNKLYISNSDFLVNFRDSCVEYDEYSDDVVVRLVRCLNSDFPLKEKVKIHDNGDGTATDMSTGLTWMRFTLGQSWDGSRAVGEPYLLTYEDALLIKNNFAGFNDWRVPSVGELNSIVDRSTKPYVDLSIFGETEFGSFVTSTKSDSYKNGRYYVSLVSGEVVVGSTSTSPVMLVRGGSSSLYLNLEKKNIHEISNKNLFSLNVIKNGDGFGAVTCNPDFEKHIEGSVIILTAQAEEGSIFNGWQGDASGLDTCCTLAMDSAKSVIADFLKLDVPDLGIVVQFDSVEDANMKSGDEALILYFSIANNGQKQVCVELPLSSYITNHGEEIEQSVWLSGCLLGSKSSTLRAGTFRKMGLVFHKSRLAQVALGDDLHVTVFQAKPERRLSFTFRCIHKEPRQFTLIKAVAELTQALDQDGEVSLEKLEILQRLTLLEEGVRDILRRLDALQFAPVTLPEPVNKNILPEPTRTLPEVLSWLATQDRISMATLRGQLLPLDLLPSAVIDDVNERAYDLAGEAALEDDGDAVMVQRDVLLQVLAAWDD